MTRQEKALKLGMKFIWAGEEVIRRTFNVKRYEIPRLTVRTFLKALTGLGSDTISLSDSKYYATGWEHWRDIIWYDLIDQRKYQDDYFDCDNFAMSYAARAAHLYKLNTCGVAYGTIYSNKTGNRLGRHAFNIIVAREEDHTELYCYEPMTDGFAKIEKGQPIELAKPNWRYEPDWVLMF